jgi:hypothetical protein
LALSTGDSGRLLIAPEVAGALGYDVAAALEDPDDH